MEFLSALQTFSEAPITRQVLMNLLKDYKRPHDKIHELTRQGVLLPVKRGIYVPGNKLAMTGPEPFLLANHLYGPSYVSIDAALSYWGLIPEKVFEISSVTTARSKVYKTLVGRFTYIHLPLPYYTLGIQQVALTKKQVALVASPEKALCDKVVTSAGLSLRSIRQVNEWLLQDLRIDKQSLTQLNKNDIAAWIGLAPKKSSIRMLVETLAQYG